MGLRAKSVKAALALLRGRTSGHVDVVDDDGTVRMQVVIPRRYRSTGTCSCCGAPLYCDTCTEPTGGGAAGRGRT